MAYYKVRNAVVAAHRKLEAMKRTPYLLRKWRGLNGEIARQKPAGYYCAEQTGEIRGCKSGSVILHKAAACQLAERIDELNIGADHLRAKLDLTWLALYQHADRSIGFMDSAGTVAPRPVKTLPCHNCGIVIPVDCIQVDHYMPQAGGEDLYTLKVLRALGLTKMAPSGSKGLRVASGNRLSGMVLHPKGRSQGNYNHLSNTSDAGKWTTSQKGNAFLSLLNFIDALPDLKRACKNTLLNLVPLCGACNREKSDYVKQIQ